MSVQVDVASQKTPGQRPQPDPVLFQVQATTAIAEMEGSSRRNSQSRTVAQPTQKSQKPELYPIGPNGKRDFSKSPAQRENPDKVFDSDMTVCFRDVTVGVKVPVKNEVKSILSPINDGFEAISTCGQSCVRKDFYRIKDVSGVIRPGTMTLVLSPPGEGKSTYLRALASRIEITSGRVAYNGHTYEEAVAVGCDITKTLQVVDQVDTHIALLTVAETFDFAHRLTSVKYEPQRVEDVITLLGMEECRDTIVGSAVIRGISGGQKKRVTIGELLLSDASTLFLDEYSNGLDASTAEDIGKGLRKFCRKYNNSIVATLQQPTPELFDLFDRIVILRDGHVVFDGPVEDVVPYFAAMGFQAPDDVDTADFLMDCLAQPKSVILSQRENELHLSKNTGQKAHKPQTIMTSYGPLEVCQSPCITVEEMVEFYKTTPQWKEIEEALNENLPEPVIDSLGRTIYAPVDHSIHAPLFPTEESKVMYKLGYRLPLVQLVLAVISRQFKIFIRNTSTLIPRIIIAFLMSLVYGSLFWNIRADSYVLRLASFTICVAQVAFGNFVEIPLSAQSSWVVKKQLSAKFYPSWAYTLATYLTAIPMSIVETVIYSLFLYFMTNAYRAPAEFFIYLCILIATSLCLSAWFRFLSAVGGDEQNAQSLAAPTTGLFLVFAGLFVTRSSIPNGMIWLYYISPFSWACRAMAINEFASSRYDDIVKNAAGDDIRIGNLYLATIDIFTQRAWVGWGIMYLLVLSWAIIFFNAFFLRTRFYEESVGTRRSEEEIVETPDILPAHDDHLEHDDELLKQQVKAAAIQQAEIQREQSRANGGSIVLQAPIIDLIGDNAPAAVTSDLDALGSGSSGASSALKTLREYLPFTPAWLSFSNVTYTVQVKKGKETVDRVLLNQINGYAQPSKMLALMGASGAGKTTLLDVIAGLKNTGQVVGSIKINGQNTTKELIANMTSYVEQFDTLFPYDTVEHTLLFAARLRLPASISDEVKHQIVDEIIDILDLGSIRTLMIGNAKTKGLSPAQCKRVNIGLELVANPSIIFLDEPTTGLDSKSAQNVMKTVKRIARSGRAIICTIHQPSAELFFLFDRLLLLGTGGYQIYHGDLGRRAAGLVKYLSRCPGVSPIKPRVNPATWMLIELGVGVAAEKGGLQGAPGSTTTDQIEIEDEPEWANLAPAQRTVQKFHKIYSMSSECTKTMKRISILESIEVIEPTDVDGMERYKQEVEMMSMKTKSPAVREKRSSSQYEVSTIPSKTTLPHTTVIIPPKNRAPWYSQARHLVARNFMAYWRNQTFIYSRYSIQLILSILFGLIYFNLKATDVPSATSLIGAIFMGVAFSAISIMQTFIPTAFETRPTFYREKASGYYQATWWAISQVLIELFFTVPSLIVTILPTYFMIGLKHDPATFFGYVFFTWLLFLVYMTTAMAICACVVDSGAAGVLAGAFLSFSTALSGIVIPSGSISRGWAWVYQALPMQHVLQGLVVPQFRGNTNLMPVVVGGAEIKVTVEYYALHAYLGWSPDQHLARQVIWIALFLILTLSTAILATNFLSHNKR